MEHFIRKGHNITDMKVTGIEKVKKNTTVHRRISESSWTDRMDSLINGEKRREELKQVDYYSIMISTFGETGMMGNNRDALDDVTNEEVRKQFAVLKQILSYTEENY